jgi:hypothetical protein
MENALRQRMARSTGLRPPEDAGICYRCENLGSSGGASVIGAAPQPDGIAASGSWPLQNIEQPAIRGGSSFRPGPASLRRVRCIGMKRFTQISIDVTAPERRSAKTPSEKR